MKAFFQTLVLVATCIFGTAEYALAQATSAQLFVTLTSPSALSATQSEFYVLAAGASNYVPNPCVTGCNKDGSFLTIDIRINPPTGLSAVNYAVTPRPGFSTPNAPADLLGNLSCYTLQPAVAFQLERNSGTPDLNIYPSYDTLARVVVTSIINSTGNNTLRTTTPGGACQTRESFWSNPHPDNTNVRLAISNPPVPLSSGLLTFSAAATPERTAKLEWQTATEKNSSHFIVERSADGMRFTEQVVRMQAAGNSNDLLTYHNFDYKPLTGDNYYRLKMVDKDGSHKYSETRRVFFEAPLADVVAIPNPFPSATTIRVSADLDQMANYHVMDYTGRVVRSGVWEVKKGVQEFPMPLDDAASGNYILTVQGSTILAELKLTKSN